MTLIKYSIAAGAVAIIAALTFILLTRYDPTQPYFSSHSYWFAKTADLKDVKRSITPRLSTELAEKGMNLNDPVFLRIFKEEAALEVWKQQGSQYQLFKTYEICSYSGKLGPKLKEGDKQAPEGFYRVSSNQLNPHSVNHLAFNIGFPNSYDRANNRTGSFLMVHGNCLSAGCYAMTDAHMEEIYLLVETAQKGGQRSVPTHIFPFRMTETNMIKHASSEWVPFWENLQEGYSWFEESRTPPRISVSNKSYTFN
ncbi:hypothetical protein PsAD2_01131 [Pseudovibrio axinellae]|uniref:L,D-TPase catalytic domain-containing protein n=1 Tax=Pseudovibrio axinellae TaxID=989403 RepID=A0A166A5L7_9HYPH|nr:murein L,D-transpeptidase family protein [Pseudovibrio axinellae]KZL20645.1 hypothetical protein PsAD2_01131 [Pseudovibrio axinellae]SER26958.1 hypothetical protein SAMN05421798_107246 [Pseudovibrio axinellae]